MTGHSPFCTNWLATPRLRPERPCPMDDAQGLRQDHRCRQREGRAKLRLAENTWVESGWASSRVKQRGQCPARESAGDAAE